MEVLKEHKEHLRRVLPERHKDIEKIEKVLEDDAIVRAAMKKDDWTDALVSCANETISVVEEDATFAECCASDQRDFRIICKLFGLTDTLWITWYDLNNIRDALLERGA